MNYTSLIADLTAALPSLEIRENEPLSGHCSFRIGGPADVMLLPGSSEELEAACVLLFHRGVKPLLLGNGTNMLFPDAGLRRVVLKTCPGAGRIAVSGTTVTAEAGATLARTAAAAQAAGLTGLEFAHGIPGSVGGGAVMNAGAYGGELKDVLVTTDCLDGTMARRTLRGDEHGFSYRHSVLSDRPDCVVLRCAFALTPGDPDTVAARMRELMEKRRTSQPLEMPSAGSTFKRPVGGYAAALIDEAGLKGFRIGGAQVSPKHAGFVVNAGGATCEDVLRLMEHIQTVVASRTGITLEPEVRVIRD